MTVVETVVEKWQSMTEGTIWVAKWDPTAPGVKKSERVRAGKTILITPEERVLLNSDRIDDETMDPFKNGKLRPITGDMNEAAREREAEIAAVAEAQNAPNPNHMSDDELGALYAIRNSKQFQKAVNEITSQAVLGRLRQLAENPDYNATVAMVNHIESRLTGPAQITGSGVEVVEVEQTSRVGGGEDNDRNVGFQPFKG